jgi:fructose-1,6-bisphosphatase I
MVSPNFFQVTKRETNKIVAGGQALNSKMQRMMEIVPEHIHDRSGIFMGSYDEIEKVKAFHK